MSHIGKSVLLALALAFTACASTTLLSTWRNPSVGQLAFHKVLVIVPNHDESLRRAAEDELVSQFKHTNAVASYTIIPESELGNNEQIRERAKQAGFDGAVVMRLVNVSREANWVPGAVVGPYYAYGGWPVYDPGYVQIDTYVRLETNVYALADDKMAWASASVTTNPSSVRSLVSSTAHAVGKEMRKEGLLPPE
jgi:hypothetical protein